MVLGCDQVRFREDGVMPFITSSPGGLGRAVGQDIENVHKVLCIVLSPCNFMDVTAIYIYMQ